MDVVIYIVESPAPEPPIAVVDEEIVAKDIDYNAARELVERMKEASNG